jgi:adenylate cyclase
MKCRACKYDNESSALFCEECGSKLARTCSNCGAEVKASAKFCPQCGTAITATTTETQGSVHRVADYTPRHLAVKILQSKSALEGERKQVTVMFADVKGSMDLAGQLDPEQWHAILDGFFQILGDAVHRFEGTVNQYTGDGIMALFGAPIAHEDHAQRACHSALLIQAEIENFGAKIKNEYGVGFATRMGLNSGEVVVGKIGDDLRMDYTAQGHTVGLAQRMESLAESNQCYLTPTTSALVSGHFLLDDLGEFEVKGVTHPVRIHRLVKQKGARTRPDPSSARGLSNFVGRTADIRALEDALGQTMNGNSQVVGIVAEAGTGKSRLSYEFLEQCRARGLKVFEAAAVAHGRDVPFLPILELFRAYFGITPEDTAGQAHEKITAGCAGLNQGDAEVPPLLAEFLGVLGPQETAPRLEPDVRQRLLVEVMRQLIHDKSRAQTTVTLIEDLHWLDQASAEFLELMIEVRAESHHLLVLNFRPEYHAEWMHKSWYRQIPLTPLGSEAVGELLNDMLGDSPGLAGLADLIYAHAAGNPFFTEELVRSLIESGTLKGTRGAYQLVTPIHSLEVPATVQAVLAARVDRLPEREKSLLQVASVIGKDFAQPLLAAVAALSTDELKAALAGLHRAEFIYERASYPVAEYAFQHPLTQEVAFGSQLRERRRQVHAAVAQAIECQYAPRLDEHAAMLAQHWEGAGDLLNAARWHRHAAEWVGLTDFSAANQHWQRVRQLARELPEDEESAALGIAACTRLLGMSLSTNSGLEEARSLLEEGQVLANTIGDRRAHLGLSEAYGFALNSAGQMVTYLELATENHRAALEIDDIGIQANASMYLVDALVHSGRLQETLDAANDGLARFPRDIPPEEWIGGLNPYSMFTLCRGYCLSWMGRRPDGFKEFERCCRLAKEDGTLEYVGYAMTMAAEANWYGNDAEEAQKNAMQCEEICNRLHRPANMVAASQLAFGYASLAAGEAVDAIAPARAALNLHGTEENEMTGWSANLLANALFATGDYDAAVVAAIEAIRLCKRSQRALHEAIAHGILARATLRRDGVNSRAEVAATLDRAETLIEFTGAQALSPALSEWRAELAATSGDTAASEKLLHQAAEGYEAIGAPRKAKQLAVNQ